MNPPVAAAIAQLERAFAGHAVSVLDNGDGGAFVIVDDLELGPAFTPARSWIGFQIPALYPRADVYPHYVCSELVRADGGPLTTPLNPCQAMPGFDRPAVHGFPPLQPVGPRTGHGRTQAQSHPHVVFRAGRQIPGSGMMRPRFIAHRERAAGEAWQLIVPGSLWAELDDHLFPGDQDEHGAVITAGIVQTERGTRLLARELFLAPDGKDFLPSPNAHRRLTAEFVNQRIRHCRDEQLAYLAIHNHGGTGRVAFSGIDLRSHERGYPALLDIARGQPVGALVIARGAVAGDIWTPDGHRHEIGETVILERNISRLHPQPTAAPAAYREIDDRQVRLYGAAGQAILQRLKVGVIGAGGIGLPVATGLARLGVGHIVAIDPDRVEPSNLPRLPESTRLDAMSLLDAEGRPQWLRRLGRRLATPKVRVARRTSRRAHKGVVLDAIQGNVSDADVTRQLIDCDYMFLAADSHTARAVFNQLVHQYLIPGVQIGSKIEFAPDGQLRGVYSVVRPVTPDAGCLWCNELISAARITDESLPDHIREAQRYVPAEDAPAPSVGTLNALGVAQATNHFMLAVTRLLRESSAGGDYRRFDALTERQLTEIPRKDPDCIECGLGTNSIRARGSSGAGDSVRRNSVAP